MGPSTGPVYWFADLAEARQAIEDWRVDYNTCRPHSSLGYLCPDEYALREQIVGGDVSEKLSFGVVQS